ncbi:formimidoylglutamase [Moheibacter lacus]|uniref:Formimidoylglutamase n=1 Tax=Moheibacter lacus TaxID=2745851 RepID=A0A838ZRQ6_9FLAO|nr:formimidoylglutamase [Moheibacter lacus]MBA5629452.1 formimidoylglutamase [Moheibacter lacus]
MVNEFLTPVSDELRGLAAELDQFSIGSSLRFDTEIAENALVILGVRDTRGGKESFNDELEFDSIRKAFYQLKKGGWNLEMYDLGDLHAGATREDTHFAFLKIQEELLKKRSILIILGGAPELVYTQFRAFDVIQHTVNLSCVDNRFRLGNDGQELHSQNYFSKIITNEPHTLFEYHHLGYQTYFVAQEELDLMEHLNFDVKRLGKLTDNVKEAEPELRNSDVVVLNLEAIQSSDFRSTVELSPNGFNSREICSIARYAGINNKVRSFGVYNFKAKNIPSDELLVAEILWYFIEGKNHVPEQINFEKGESLETFFVQIPEQDLVFYRDTKADQWWMELGEMNDAEPLGKQVIPCSLKDYEDSLKGKVPDRWWKSFKKLY